MTNFKLQRLPFSQLQQDPFGIIDKKSAPWDGFFSSKPVNGSGGDNLEAITYASSPSANVNAADTALLVTHVQSDVLDWVELQASTVGETYVT